MWARFDTFVGRALGWIGPRVFPRFHFERVYSSAPDPWSCATSVYEQLKYEHTLGALPPESRGRMLEVGCGEGIFTEKLAPRAAEVLGIDISEAALTRARARCAALPNVSFRRLDVMSEPIPQGFDVVVAAEVLYYLGSSVRYQRICGKLADAIADDGRLVVVNPWPEAKRLQAPFSSAPRMTLLAENIYPEGRAYSVAAFAKHATGQ